MAQLNKFNHVDLKTGDFAYYVGEVPNGEAMGRPGHYFPGIVVRGEPGYYCTDWDWGTDKARAQECADDLNKKLGLTVEQAGEIILSSMFAGPIAKQGKAARRD